MDDNGLYWIKKNGTVSAKKIGVWQCLIELKIILNDFCPWKLGADVTLMETSAVIKNRWKDIIAFLSNFHQMFEKKN